MKNERQQDRQRLYDILDAIAAIERHQPTDGQSLLRDELLLVWLAHHIQIIGEAAGRLSTNFKDAHPAQPWRKIIGMRNIIVHGYSTVDPAEIWTAVERDMPGRKAFGVKVLADADATEADQ